MLPIFPVILRMGHLTHRRNDWKKPSNAYSIRGCQGFHDGGHRRETVPVKIILDYEPSSSWVSRDPLGLPGLISNSCQSPVCKNRELISTSLRKP